MESFDYILEIEKGDEIVELPVRIKYSAHDNYLPAENGEVFYDLRIQQVELWSEVMGMWLEVDRVDWEGHANHIEEVMEDHYKKERRERVDITAGDFS